MTTYESETQQELEGRLYQNLTKLGYAFLAAAMLCAVVLTVYGAWCLSVLWWRELYG